MTRLVALTCVYCLIFAGSAEAVEDPDFTTLDRAGRLVSLSQLLEESRLVVVNFWLAGCAPSNELLPYLQAFQEEYAEDGLSCIVIYRRFDCTSELGEDYLEQHVYGMPVVEDRSGELQRLFDVEAFPHTFVICKDWEILFDECGYRSGDETQLQGVIHGELRNELLPQSEVIHLPEEQ